MHKNGGIHPHFNAQALKEQTSLGYLSRMGQMVRIILNIFSAKTDLFPEFCNPSSAHYAIE